jgi:hypothetical protein
VTYAHIPVIRVTNAPLKATGILANRKYVGSKSGTTHRKAYIIYIRPYPVMTNKNKHNSGKATGLMGTYNTNYGSD